MFDKNKDNDKTSARTDARTDARVAKVDKDDRAAKVDKDAVIVDDTDDDASPDSDTDRTTDGSFGKHAVAIHIDPDGVYTADTVAGEARSDDRGHSWSLGDRSRLGVDDVATILDGAEAADPLAAKSSPWEKDVATEAAAEDVVKPASAPKGDAKKK